MGRRFMVPLLIVCSLLVSVAVLMGISMLWQQETLAVRDIQGSPSALEPYQVTGNWGDDFHNLSFTLSQGEIQRDVSFEKEEETPPEIEEWKGGDWRDGTVCAVGVGRTYTAAHGGYRNHC